MKPKSAYAHVPWMILATVAFSSMALFVKNLAMHLTGLEVVFYRSLSHLVILAPIVYFGRVPVWREFSAPVLARSVLAFLGVALYFISLSRLDAGLASLLQWSAPAFTFLYAAFALKEKITLRAFLCLLFAFGGVSWAVGVGTQTLAVSCAICLLIAVGGAACAGISYGVLKSTTAKASPESLATWMSLVSLAGALIGLGGKVTWVTGRELWVVLIVGALVSVYQFSVAKAYEAAPAIRVAPFSVAPAITVLLLESLLNHRAPEANQLWGSLLTVGSLVSLAVAPRAS